MIPILLAAALALPVPSSPPIPVSTPAFSAAPLEQNGVHVASNGSVTLAVWNDGRSGRTDVTACRVSADGTPRDPMGIVIREGAEVEDLFWNGTSFVVVTGPGLSLDPESVVSYVTPEGEVAAGDVLAPGSMLYAARTGEGADARFLFVPFDASPARARVVDLHGNVVRAGDYRNDGDGTALTASHGSGFLELRGYSPNLYATPITYLAYTLDRDGNVVQSSDPHLPASFACAALITDPHGGYILFGDLASGDLALIPLDANGVVAGPAQVIQKSDPFGWNLDSLTVTPTSDGFVATWFDNMGNLYLSRNGGAPAVTFASYARGIDTAYEPLNDLLFASCDLGNSSNTDVFVQKGSGSPVPITQGALRQTNAAIAAGANGFLVAWAEADAGENAYIYVRRYASDATPLGDIQVAATDLIHSGISHFIKISITSSGNAYLVTWERYGFSWARRMDARTGNWIDDEPFPVDLKATASNGKDALGITVGECRVIPTCHTTLQPISMSGGSPVSPVNVSDIAGETTPAIGSNGADYLAVWSECLVGCYQPGVNRVVAMRVRADGTRIDASPIVLDSGSSYWSLAVAWNGQTYLVTWSAPNGDARAAYVGSDGAVQQLGTIRGLRAASKIVAHAGEFLLLSDEPLGYSRDPNELRVTLLDGSRTAIATRPSMTDFGPLDAASDGAHLMLVYDRVDEAAGRVGRVFVEPRVFPTRKRAVTRGR